MAECKWNPELHNGEPCPIHGFRGNQVSINKNNNIKKQPRLKQNNFDLNSYESFFKNKKNEIDDSEIKEFFSESDIDPENIDEVSKEFSSWFTNKKPEEIKEFLRNNETYKKIIDFKNNCKNSLKQWCDKEGINFQKIEKDFSNSGGYNLAMDYGLKNAFENIFEYELGNNSGLIGSNFYNIRNVPTSKGLIEERYKG